VSRVVLAVIKGLGRVVVGVLVGFRVLVLKGMSRGRGGGGRETGKGWKVVNVFCLFWEQRGVLELVVGV